MKMGWVEVNKSVMKDLKRCLPPYNIYDTEYLIWKEDVMKKKKEELEQFGKKVFKEEEDLKAFQRHLDSELEKNIRKDMNDYHFSDEDDDHSVIDISSSSEEENKKEVSSTSEEE